MARPKKIIDKGQVAVLASINCTNNEIAAVIGCDVRTLERRFAATIKIGREQGKSSLKRRMWETAMSNNKGAVVMQIWLSKQMLGYTDSVDINHQVNNQPKVIWDFRYGDSDPNVIDAEVNPTAITYSPIEEKV